MVLLCFKYEFLSILTTFVKKLLKLQPHKTNVTKYDQQEYVSVIILKWGEVLSALIVYDIQAYANLILY